MASVNTKLSDALTRHSLYLYRVELGMRNQINANIDATIPQLRAVLLEADALESMRTNTAAYAEALASLDRKIAKARGDGFTAAQDASRKDYIEAIRHEVDYADDVTKEALVSPLRKGTRTATKEALVMGAVTKTQAENILAYGSFQGRTIKRWWTEFEASDLQKIDNAVRTGLADGQTMQQITRNLIGTKKQNYKDGILETTRRNAETVARTTLNGVTNDARLTYYEQNSDIVSSVKYLATLDSRTSEICASRDGNIYPLGEEPALPAHPNCRSTYTPVIDGLTAATERPAITKNLNKEAQAQYMQKQVDKGMSKTNARKKWNALSRSTKDKYYYEQYNKYADSIGTVPGKTTYESFLRRQPKEFVQDHLGKTKAEMWLTGATDSTGKKVSLGTFINNDTGKPYTIAEIAVREKSLYGKAIQAQAEIEGISLSRANVGVGASQQAWENALPQADRDSLKKWTLDDYIEIVPKQLHEAGVKDYQHWSLKTWHEAYSGLPGKMKEISDKTAVLENILQNAPKHKGTVYRGISVVNPDEMFSQLKKGRIQLNSFTSSSRSKKIAEGFMGAHEHKFLFEIKATGKNGVNIEKFASGDRKRELEVLFPKGTNFRVVSAKPSSLGTIVQLEEIAP